MARDKQDKVGAMLRQRDMGRVPQGSAWAMVTGAALGIGREYAWQLAKLGYNVVMVDILDSVATEAATISKSCGVACVAKVMDLAVEGAAHELHCWSVSERYEFDVVINNAGIFSFLDVINTPTERLERMLILHDLTLTTMCRLYGEDMVKRGRGRLLNMSSYSIWMPYPGLATYSASKAYVRSFTRAFARELHGTGVTATAICPAGVATDLYGLRKDMQAWGLRWGVLMSASSCARRGLRAMFRGRNIVVPDWWFRVLIPICNYLPDWLIRPLRRKTMKIQR